MKQLLIITVTFLLISVVNAQSPYKLEKGLAYKIAINNARPLFLVAVTDSSLVTSPDKSQYGNIPGNATETPYHEIDRFNLRRAGAPGRGLLYGTLGGIGAGVLGGLAAGTSHGWGKGANAFFGGLMGIIPGALIGAIIGSREKKYAPRKSREGFRNATQYIYR